MKEHVHKWRFEWESSWKNDRNMKEHVYKYAGLNVEIIRTYGNMFANGGL